MAGGIENQPSREGGESSPGVPSRKSEQVLPQQVSDERFAEEFRQAEEARMRKLASIHKMLESRIRNETLTPEERYEKQLEYMREYCKANKEKVKEWQRTSRQRRKERKKLQREQHQPTQVFPPPENEQPPR